MRRLVRTACFAIAGLAPALTHSQTIVDEWAGIKAPAPPTLKAVTIDPKTTALLMLDFVNQGCGPRPRCVASIPASKKLLDEARSRGMAVMHSVTGSTRSEDIVKELAPRDGEPVVTSSVDKFRNTELEKMLKDRGIQTVITIGTSANGAVLNTATGAVVRGLKSLCRSTACRPSIRSPSNTLLGIS